MFKFHEGQSVALREDDPVMGLKAGDTGVVWAMYATDPLSYEVTFCLSTKDAFDMTVTEDDIVAAESSTLQQGRKAGEREIEVA